MYKLISTQHKTRTYETLSEAKTAKGIEYNLYLADLLEKDITANPVRKDTEFLSYILDGEKRVEWKIKKKPAK